MIGTYTNDIPIRLIRVVGSSFIPTRPTPILIAIAIQSRMGVSDIPADLVIIKYMAVMANGATNAISVGLRRLLVEFSSIIFQSHNA